MSNDNLERTLDYAEKMAVAINLDKGLQTPLIHKMIQQAVQELKELRAEVETWKTAERLALDTVAALRADNERIRQQAVDYALIVEQFQKLLGAYTTTSALSKVAALMREESVVNAEIASLRAELDGKDAALEAVRIMLDRWDEAFSTDIFGEVRKDEIDQYGSLISRNSAAMGRWMVGVLRDRLERPAKDGDA